MRKINPEISVVIPVYNAEDFLEETIQSILDQTFKNFELIIINDKSPDNSSKIIEKYAKKDKRIIVLENEKNMGCVYSRNRGVKISRGKYMAIMDSDDVCLPNRFETQFNYLENHPEIYLVGGSVIVIDEKGNKMGSFIKYENYNKIKKKLPKFDFIFHSSIMYRNTKEFYYRKKFLNSDDYDFLLNLLSENKKMVNLKEFLIKYRINQNSITSTGTYQSFFFQKAKDFYFQREKNGEDDYENLRPPNKKIFTDLEKRNLRIKIIAEFQDDQRKSARKNIRKFFKRYGFNKVLFGYFILSFFPLKVFKSLR